MRLLPALLALCACEPDVVVVEGTILSSRDPGAAPLDGGTVEILDLEGGLWSSAITQADGTFSTTAPAGSTIFAVVSRAPDLAPASFTGTSGVAEVMQVEEGAIYGFSSEERADWATRLAGCPGGEGEGIAVGEVRVWELTDEQTGEHPLVTTAWLTATSEDGEEVSACYVDIDGIWDPGSDRTGEAGTFALTGLRPGRWLLEISFEFGGGYHTTDTRTVRVTEGGVVPMFPLWVSWPGW